MWSFSACGVINWCGRQDFQHCVRDLSARVCVREDPSFLVSSEVFVLFFAVYTEIDEKSWDGRRMQTTGRPQFLVALEVVVFAPEQNANYRKTPVFSRFGSCWFFAPEQNANYRKTPVFSRFGSCFLFCFVFCFFAPEQNANYRKTPVFSRFGSFSFFLHQSKMQTTGRPQFLVALEVVFLHQSKMQTTERPQFVVSLEVFFFVCVCVCVCVCAESTQK